MKIKLLSILTILFLSKSVIWCEVSLPKLISDGMVLQRDADIKIWGWAEAEEKVVVDFLDKTYRTVTNQSGHWEIRISELKAGGPYQMIVKGSNTIAIDDILVGDVWICSGQSNMELNMQRASPLYGKEIADCKNPSIRYFHVQRTYNFKAPQEDISDGKWLATNPSNILRFSAVSYFFAKELYSEYNVPIGLINSALGGSPAQAWLSEEALKAFPEHYQEGQRFKDYDLIKKIQQEDEERSSNWYSMLNKQDKGYQDKSWKSSDLDDSEWATMNIPGYWADEVIGDVNGVVWFRKEVKVPASTVGEDVKLLLGRIVDSDSVFVNGTYVGNVTYQYPPRRYLIPSGILKKGKNTIVVRVVNSSGKGGFVLDKEYIMKSNIETIDLSGEWKYKLGATMSPLASQTFIRWKPGGLYNAMIAPLLNYGIKGVIWYQGESNTKSPEEYDQIFPAMIRNWRQDWQQGNFPFLFVQLANFMEDVDEPSESNWARLRESQEKALQVSNTGMAVTIDIGEWNDIHPLNKKDVGKRLALAAHKLAYGNDEIVHAGPMFKSMKAKRKKIILSFDNVGGGLLAHGGQLREFAIAAKDKKYVWAKAKIKGNKVVVCSKEVKKPIAVRYGWAHNPQAVNLYNKEGLPASPFRTDDW